MHAFLKLIMKKNIDIKSELFKSIIVTHTSHQKCNSIFLD